MAPRLVSGPTAPTASKILKKERIVQVLSRMNDRDTQKAAAEDLLSLVLNIDQEGLPILVSCLCSTGSEHKVYARKECARAIGALASDSCPLHELALQPPHVGRMLAQLRKSLQDPDTGVREASAEALSVVAQGLAQVEMNGAQQGNLGNPVVKLIFECLAEQKKELNAAACAALGQAAPYLGTLDASLARDLVRKLNSGSFQAPSALLAAIARSDPASGEPVGLMKSGPAAFFPVFSALIGQPAPQSVASSSGTIGSGVAGALSRPDWPVRLAAADMLRSTALLLGPIMELDGCWTRSDLKSIVGRAIRALESCKFDKVREVRDVARNALAVLEALHDYGSTGGSAAGWPAHIMMKNGQDLHLPVATSTFTLPAYAADAAGPGPLVPGRKSPVRRSAVSPSRRPRSGQPQSRAGNSPPPDRVATPPERRSSPMLARGGSVSERFRAAHRDGDVVSIHYLGGVDSEPLPGSAREMPDAGLAQPSEPELAEAVMARAAGHDFAPPEEQPGSRRVSRQQSKSSETSTSRAGGRVPPVDRLPSGALGVPDELLRNLSLEDDAVALLGYGGPPTFSDHVLEPLSGAALAALAAPEYASQAAVVASNSTSAPPPEAVVWPPRPPAPTTSNSEASMSVPVEEWLAAQQRLRSLEQQQRQLLEAFNSMAEQNRQTVAGLQAKVSGLEAALQTAQSLVASSALQDEQQRKQQEQRQEQLSTEEESPVEAEVSWMSRTIRPGSPLIAPIFEEAAASNTALELPPGGSGAGSSDVQQAYREVLAIGRVSDMHLLRLMQRTGPIWGDLGPELSAQLLAAFIANLQQARADGPMLSRMMPWLWRLADEQNTAFETPPEMRGTLVAALRTAQAAVTDSSLNDRISLLVNTLKTHWSLPDGSPVAAGHRFSQPQPAQQPVYLASPSHASAYSTSTAPPQEISLGAGVGLPKQLDGERAPVAPTAFSSIHATTPLVSASSQSPVKEPADMSEVTPRVAVVRGSQVARSGKLVSMGTLMGQWSDLQRDFAAMASPSNRPMSRGQG